MSSVRGAASLLCAAACLLLGSCAGTRLSTTAPAGVSLAGTWRLDPAASDDPLLSARSAAYSQSFTRREGEPKEPSAVSTAETEK